MRRPTLEATLKGRQATTNHARVVEQLGRDIVSGRIDAGALLPGDAELAQRFQVSRTVLREALKTLDAKGLISPRVRIGTSIRARAEWNHFDPEVLLWYIEAGVDARLLSQLAVMRMAFEPVAAGLAAHNASAAQIAAIDRDVSSLLSGTHSAEDAVALMLSIHTAVTDASANVFLQSCCALLKAALIGQFRNDPAFAAAVCLKAGDSYRALVSALMERDGKAATSAMAAIVRAAGSPT